MTNSLLAWLKVPAASYIFTSRGYEMVTLVTLIGIYLMVDNVDHLLMYCFTFTYLRCDVSLSFFLFVLVRLSIVDGIVILHYKSFVRYRFCKYFSS